MEPIASGHHGRPHTGDEWRCFEGDAGGETPQHRTSKASAEKERKHPRLVCAACGRDITSVDARVSIDGGHEHAFVNPHGFAYRIGCFSSAPGCAATGEPSREFSWFRGYAWQLAVCGGCNVHLGWRFSGESPAFFGLILDRLTEADDAPPA